MSNGSIPGSMGVSLSSRELEIIGLVAEEDIVKLDEILDETGA